MDPPVDQLLLAMRQCATHPAGPTRAVYELQRWAATVGPADIRLVEEGVRVRVQSMQMPEDRRVIVDTFIDVVFAGLMQR